MRKYILLLVTLMYTQFMIGQAIGSWKTYPALQIATYNVPVTTAGTWHRQQAARDR